MARIVRLHLGPAHVSVTSLVALLGCTPAEHTAVEPRPSPAPIEATTATATATTTGSSVDSGGSIASTFVKIATEDTQSCAVLSGGEAYCFGGNPSIGDPIVLPAGVVARDVVLGPGYGCLLGDQGEIACFGCLNWDDRPLCEPPSGTFHDLNGGGGEACAIRDSDGALLCWGNFPSPIVVEGGVGDYDVAEMGVCGVPPGGGPVWCLPDGGAPLVEGQPPAGLELIDIALGGDHGCGVLADGEITCWGFNDYPDPPEPGPYLDVEAAGSITCARRPDLTVLCWASEAWWDLHPHPAPAGAFVDLDVGWYNACGVRTDGSAVCWGSSGPYVGEWWTP